VLLFGLTGGIASGKSTVAARFRERGLPVIDADILAREVVAPKSEGLAAVVEAFGDGVLDESGALDRKRLAEIVFTDEARRKRLNAILHPRIGALTAMRASELADRGEKAACYEAALLVENGLAEAFRPLVVVAVDEAVQIARAMERDRATFEEASARVRAQLPLAEKVKLADHVIDNSGSREATRARADEVLDLILNTRR
jgi:dephospho-CoA kinase